MPTRKRAVTQHRHFTEGKISAFKVPEKTIKVYDAQVRTLGLKLLPNGRRVYFWWRSVAGKPVWKTIGDSPEIALADARSKAQGYDVTLAVWKKDGCAGPNPFAHPDVSGALTLEALAELYIEQQVMKYSSRPDFAAREVRRMLGCYLAGWKLKKLDEIHRGDVLKLHTEIGKEHGKLIANRVIDLLRGLYNFAADRELSNGVTNPARLRKEEKFKEKERTRCLSPEEFVRLYAALDAERNKDLRDFVLLSLATAQRKKTVLRAEWDAIDLSKQTWTLARTQTKNKIPLTIELTPKACAVLRERLAKRDPGCAFVFPGIDPARPRFDFSQGVWRALLKRAELDYPRNHKLNFRGHDLRHTAISYMIMSGRSLEQAGATIGHQSSASTRRYAHVLGQVKRETALAGERQIEKMIEAAKEKLLTAEASRG
jgi:integrase